jgi:UDP-glucose 4-epimerase
MKDTVLVTGGAGYIGSHTVKELCSLGFDVVVIDSLESGHKMAVDKEATLEIADLKDKRKIELMFKKYQPKAVIDFAAYLSVGESMEDPKKYFNNNILNFINLLDSMSKYNCNLIIKSSTAAVYGNPTCDKDIPWKEKFI